MAYATQADLVARFGEAEVIALSDRAGFGVIDSAVIASAIEQAGDEIDAYLGSRYGLPLTSVPRLLVGVCCDVARYRLCGAEVTETEAARQRYKDALKLLEAVRDGKLSLGLDAAQTAVEAAGTVLIQPGRRVFTADSLGDY
jgi:phage gp36-like protein